MSPLLYFLVFVVVLPSAAVGLILYLIPRLSRGTLRRALDQGRVSPREVLQSWILNSVRSARSRLLAYRARADADIINAPAAGPGTQPSPEKPAASQPAGPARKVAPPPPFADAPPNAAGPAEIAQVMDAPISPAWHALVQWVTSFEPDDQHEHLAFFAANAAGMVAFAEACRAYGDTQLTVIGLDPAAVQATFDMADSIGDCAHDIVLAQRQFLVIYHEILSAIENGLMLPHNARQWLSRDAGAGRTGRAA